MKTTLLLALLSFVLVACGGSASDPEAPARAVVSYLEARISGDGEALKKTMCATQEGDAERLAQSFKSVQASLKDVACTYEADANKVACTGAITVLYGTEARDLPLGAYLVTQEDGVWKVCGETR
jgi:hypothetical protein